MKTPLVLRSLITPLMLLCGATVAQAQACIPVEVQNVRAGEGRLMIAGYDSAEAYAARQVSIAVQLRAEGETMSLQVCGLRGPVVALSAFQDLNGNGKLDTNAMGIPAEPWGASGKPPAFSAPTWDTTQVTLEAGKPVVVKLAK
ncbi:DUF2141 domain-containing protein [Aquabacterium sp.]|uniref:DUF2141 domain-containing protein n=1 Tax=Aquabacterium sp. TaxID=1872578 RepID=UPI003782EEFE